MDIADTFHNLFQNIKSLNSFSAWTSVDRSAILPIDWAFAAISALLLIVGVVLWVAFRKTESPIKSAYIKSWRNLFMWLGILGVVWLGCRYQFVNLFGTRAVFLLLVVVGLVLGARLFISVRKKMSHENMEWLAKQQKLKYLTKT